MCLAEPELFSSGRQTPALQMFLDDEAPARLQYFLYLLSVHGACVEVLAVVCRVPVPAVYVHPRLANDVLSEQKQFGLHVLKTPIHLMSVSHWCGCWRTVTSLGNITRKNGILTFLRDSPFQVHFRSLKRQILAEHCSGQAASNKKKKKKKKKQLRNYHENTFDENGGFDHFRADWISLRTGPWPPFGDSWQYDCAGPTPVRLTLIGFSFRKGINKLFDFRFWNHHVWSKRERCLKAHFKKNWKSNQTPKQIYLQVLQSSMT